MTHQEFIDFLGKLTSLPQNDRTEFMQISIELPTHERARIADHLIGINADFAKNNAERAAFEKQTEKQLQEIEKKDVPAFAAFVATSK